MHNDTFDSILSTFATTGDLSDADLRRLSASADLTPLRSDQEAACGMFGGRQTDAAQHIEKLCAERSKMIERLHEIINDAKASQKGYAEKLEIAPGLVSRARMSRGLAPTSLSDALGISSREWNAVADKVAALLLPPKRQATGQMLHEIARG